MARPFNTFLRGFLGVLDAKVSGISPQNFEESMRPVMDVYPFIYAQRRQIAAFTTAALVTTDEGFRGSTTTPDDIVPSDEVWLVAQHAYNTPLLLAAEEFQATPAYKTRSNLGGFTEDFMLNTPPPIALAGTRATCNATDPYILLPGDQVGVWVQRIVTAVSIVVTFKVQFVICKV